MPNTSSFRSRGACFQNPATTVHGVTSPDSLGGRAAGLSITGPAFFGSSAAILMICDGIICDGNCGVGAMKSITGFASNGSRCDAGRTAPSAEAAADSKIAREPVAAQAHLA